MGTPERRPIEIDRASLLELARGTNLYHEPFAFLRELLQNAADATLVRLFEERGAAAFPTNEHSIWALRVALADRATDVTVDAARDEDGTERVRVRIHDHGTGISRADLPYLGALGASWRNPARRSRVEAMPEWMRPSGTFGIGIHSVFLVASELRMRTTHFSTGESLAIRIFRDEDGVSLEVEDGEPIVGGGTEVVVDVPRTAEQVREARFHLPVGYDALLEKPPDAHFGGMSPIVQSMTDAGIVPATLHGELVARRFDDARTIFDPLSGVELTWLEPGRTTQATWGMDLDAIDFANRHTLYYRGAALNDGMRDAKVKVLTNLHFGTARELLHLSRGMLTEAGNARVSRAVQDALHRIGEVHASLDAEEPNSAT